MSVNSSSPSLCNLTQSTESLIRTVYIATNVVLPPIYFTIGNLLTPVAFLFFKSQRKKNEAYGYQMYASIFKIFETFTLTADLLCLYFGGWGPVDGWVNFQSSYIAMWLTCRIVYPLAGIGVNQFIIYPSVIALDRAFAMISPITYRNIDHKTYQITAAILSIIVATAIGIDFAFDCDVLTVAAGKYKIWYGNAHMLLLKRALVQPRNVVRYSAFGIMVIASVAFIYKFRKRSKKEIGKISACQQDKEKEAKADEKALLILTSVQCCMVCLYVTVSTVVVQLRTYYPDFYACQGSLFQFTFALVGQVCGVADYCILFLYNKKFRATLMKKLKNLSKITACGGTPVENIQ